MDGISRDIVVLIEYLPRASKLLHAQKSKRNMILAKKNPLSVSKRSFVFKSEDSLFQLIIMRRPAVA